MVADGGRRRTPVWDDRAVPPPPVVPEGSPVDGPSRRAVVRLLGLAGTGLVLTGCTAADRQALLDVDPSRLRVDEGAAVRPDPPGPSERELRRRAVRAGSLAALAAYADIGAALPGPPGPPGSPARPVPPGPRLLTVLVGRIGGSVGIADALAVHRVHADVLAGLPARSSAGPSTPPGGRPATPRSDIRPPAEPLLPGVRPEAGGPSLDPAARPLAVLRAGATAALLACTHERVAPDADVPLAVLYARVAAARTAQAGALAGDGATDRAWAEVVAPGADVVARAASPPAAPVVGAPVEGAPVVGSPVKAALHALLAQEQRARWSYAVVQAWWTEREADARAARDDHARRVAQLEDLLTALGDTPAAAAATYPTDDAGTPVHGPVSASALALRLADAVAAASAAVLLAAVTASPASLGTPASALSSAPSSALSSAPSLGSGPALAPDPAVGPEAWVTWVRAAVGALAEAERARWSWGGRPAAWPGA